MEDVLETLLLLQVTQPDWQTTSLLHQTKTMPSPEQSHQLITVVTKWDVSLEEEVSILAQVPTTEMVSLVLERSLLAQWEDVPTPFAEPWELGPMDKSTLNAVNKEMSQLNVLHKQIHAGPLSVTQLPWLLMQTDVFSPTLLLSAMMETNVPSTLVTPQQVVSI